MVVALSAVAVERRTLPPVRPRMCALVGAQVVWSRRPVPPARVLGVRQLVLASSSSSVTALGVHA